MPSTRALTTPDLVLIGLLAERPMHGYELLRELDRREVRDWAEVSRPHVYYALRKLAAAGFIAVDEGAARVRASAAERKGADPRVYRLTAAGRRACAAALARPEWAEQRPPPPFRTWWALSLHATPAVRAAQVERRRRFLQGELERERATLVTIMAFDSPAAAYGRDIVELAIRQFEAELAWLDERLSRSPHRPPRAPRAHAARR